jgi:hypothetical protein
MATAEVTFPDGRTATVEGNESNIKEFISSLPDTNDTPSIEQQPTESTDIGNAVKRGAIKSVGGLFQNLENIYQGFTAPSRTTVVPTGKNSLLDVISGKNVDVKTEAPKEPGVMGQIAQEEFKKLLELPETKGVMAHLASGGTQLPITLATINLLGGGATGMAKLGALESSPNGVGEMAKGAGVGYGLGKAYELLGMIKPGIESTSKVTPLLTGLARITTGGVIGASIPLAYGESPDEVAAQTILGSVLSSKPSNELRVRDVMFKGSNYSRSKVAGEMKPRVIDKGLKKTAEYYQPSPSNKQNLQETGNGEKYPNVVKQAYEVTPGVASTHELTGFLKNESENTYKRIESLIAENDNPIARKLVDARAKLILEKNHGVDFENQSDPMVKSALNKYIEQESSIQKSKGGNILTSDAQARKLELYKQTKNVQKAQSEGANPKLAAKSEVQDAYAQAYKELVAQAHPEIDGLNQRYAGLDQAHDLANSIGQRENVEPTGLISEMGSVERVPTKVRGLGALLTHGLKPFLSTKAKTSEISGLRRKASLLDEISKRGK